MATELCNRAGVTLTRRSNGTGRGTVVQITVGEAFVSVQPLDAIVIARRLKRWALKELDRRDKRGMEE